MEIQRLSAATTHFKYKFKKEKKLNLKLIPPAVATSATLDKNSYEMTNEFFFHFLSRLRKVTLFCLITNNTLKI
jgi:hypothetical protein